SGMETPEPLVIRSYKHLKAFFAKINRTRKPGLPLPEVDFSQETVLVYCGGVTKASLKPILTLVKATDSTFFVHPEMVKREKGSSENIVTPFSLYTLPVTEKEIIFQ
ncbi:MAG: hypothetical protein AAGA86_10105, partial [Bacteroidota bacterium]